MAWQDAQLLRVAYLWHREGGLRSSELVMARSHPASIYILVDLFVRMTLHEDHVTCVQTAGVSGSIASIVCSGIVWGGGGSLSPAVGRFSSVLPERRTLLVPPPIVSSPPVMLRQNRMVANRRGAGRQTT